MPTIFGNKTYFNLEESYKNVAIQIILKIYIDKLKFENSKLRQINLQLLWNCFKSAQNLKQTTNSHIIILSVSAFQ